MKYFLTGISCNEENQSLPILKSVTQPETYQSHLQLPLISIKLLFLQVSENGGIKMERNSLMFDFCSVQHHHLRRHLSSSSSYFTLIPIISHLFFSICYSIMTLWEMSSAQQSQGRDFTWPCEKQNGTVESNVKKRKWENKAIFGNHKKHEKKEWKENFGKERKSKYLLDSKNGISPTKIDSSETKTKCLVFWTFLCLIHISSTVWLANSFATT